MSRDLFMPETGEEEGFWRECDGTEPVSPDLKELLDREDAELVNSWGFNIWVLVVGGMNERHFCSAAGHQAFQTFVDCVGGDGQYRVQKMERWLRSLNNDMEDVRDMLGAGETDER